MSQDELHRGKLRKIDLKNKCDLLSARTIFGGCSFMRYLDKKVESGI